MNENWVHPISGRRKNEYPYNDTEYEDYEVRLSEYGTEYGVKVSTGAVLWTECAGTGSPSPSPSV